MGPNATQLAGPPHEVQLKNIAISNCLHSLVVSVNEVRLCSSPAANSGYLGYDSCIVLLNSTQCPQLPQCNLITLCNTVMNIVLCMTVFPYVVCSGNIWED